MGKWYYYIRVSTKSQNLDRQEYNKKLDEFCDRMNFIGKRDWKKL